jgi:hypothetical protein
MDDCSVLLEPVNIHRNIYISLVVTILKESPAISCRSKLFKGVFLSLLPSDLISCLQNISTEPHKEGSLQVAVNVIENHFDCKVPCSPLSCSPLFSLQRKVICEEHCKSLIIQILCLALDIFSLPFKRCFLLNEEDWPFEWVAIQQSSSPDADSIPIWLDAKNEIAVGNFNSLFKIVQSRKKKCVILQFTGDEQPLVCNTLWNFTLSASMRKWLSKICQIAKKEEKKRKAPATEDDGFPATLAGFQNHPLYVLESKIGKRQALIPTAKAVGEFREIPIFLRSHLSPLKSRDAWARLGRVISQGQEPASRQTYVPRVKKLADEDGKATNELYAEWQTEPFKPKVAANGIVPKNSFGNVELFHPSMLPIGCVHLPYNGIHKIAAKLEVDWATAIVGFKFHGGRASPRSLGIVVCEEYSEQVMEAYNQFMEALELAKEKIAQEEEHKREKINARLQALIKKFEDSTSESVVVNYEKESKNIAIDSFDSL